MFPTVDAKFNNLKLSCVPKKTAIAVSAYFKTFKIVFVIILFFY